MLTVDDLPGVSRAVQRDLRRRYGGDFRVLRAESGAQALELLDELALRAEPIALLLVDQRMPGMTGVEMLAEAPASAPSVKRVLLTAYADTQAAIDAINVVRLDHYLMTPWDPHEEQLYPMIDDPLKRGELRVEGDYGDDVPPIMASASQLNQVWTNLIDNAIDAVDGAGAISVSTRRLGDRIDVCVADDGPGVPPEIQARVFEPFFTTKDVGEGAGLGLDVSLRIVCGHGGELVLGSVPGRTRFVVRIPIAAP